MSLTLLPPLTTLPLTTQGNDPRPGRGTARLEDEAPEGGEAAERFRDDGCVTGEVYVGDFRGAQPGGGGVELPEGGGVEPAAERLDHRPDLLGRTAEGDALPRHERLGPPPEHA